MTAYETYLKFSPNWQRLRSTVFQRAKGFCEVVGCMNLASEVHHLHYRTIYKERPIDLQAICRRCHAAIHGTAITLRRQQLELRLAPANDNERADYYVARDG